MSIAMSSRLLHDLPTALSEGAVLGDVDLQQTHLADRDLHGAIAFHGGRLGAIEPARVERPRLGRAPSKDASRRPQGRVEAWKASLQGGAAVNASFFIICILFYSLFNSFLSI